MDRFINFLSVEMIFLIPFLMGLGKIIKYALTTTKEPTKSQKYIQSKVKSTDNIPMVLWSIAVILGLVYGLLAHLSMIDGTLAGFINWFITGTLSYGLLQSSFCAFVAMGLYDTVKR